MILSLNRLISIDFDHQSEKVIDFRQFKLNLMNKVRRGSRKRDASNSITRNLNRNVSLNLKQTRNRRPFSLSNKNKRYHKKGSRLIISKTIENLDKTTTIEEYTDANIPEFTLGPNNFESKELPVKPLSVNRMGFYEECKDEPVVISPIKVFNQNTNKRLFNVRNSKLNPIQNQSDDDSDFYENNDIISLDTAEK